MYDWSTYIDELVEYIIKEDSSLVHLTQEQYHRLYKEIQRFRVITVQDDVEEIKKRLGMKKPEYSWVAHHLADAATIAVYRKNKLPVDVLIELIVDGIVAECGLPFEVNTFVRSAFPKSLKDEEEDPETVPKMILNELNKREGYEHAAMSYNAEKDAFIIEDAVVSIPPPANEKLDPSEFPMVLTSEDADNLGLRQELLAFKKAYKDLYTKIQANAHGDWQIKFGLRMESDGVTVTYMDEVHSSLKFPMTLTSHDEGFASLCLERREDMFKVFRSLYDFVKKQLDTTPVNSPVTIRYEDLETLGLERCYWVSIRDCIQDYLTRYEDRHARYDVKIIINEEDPENDRLRYIEITAISKRYRMASTRL